MRTRAKFVCNSVTDHGDSKDIRLTPVTGGSEENATFWKYTPSGEIKMSVLNPDVKFAPGKQYYVDFSEVPSV